MAMFMRHGDAGHFVRPDRVYRTGVVPPMTGYYPQADAQAVAEQFTAGPYWFHQGAMNAAPAAGVSGYFGGSSPGPIQRFFLRAKARRSAKQAAKMIAVARGVNGLRGPTPYGPAIMLGPMVVPAASARMQVLVQGATAHMPDAIGTAAGASVMNAWDNLRWGRP